MLPLALRHDQHADEIEEAIAIERERCAQVCIQLASMHRGTTAEAMRARRQS
jgi:hypothetical protein